MDTDEPAACKGEVTEAETLRPVTVAVRCRPMNRRETENGDGTSVVTGPVVGGLKITAPPDLPARERDFSDFDYVFGPSSTQADVWEAARPIVDKSLQGFNGALWAYGQTGSGKSFNVHGVRDVERDELQGLIPRTMSHVFEACEKMSVEDSRQSIVRCSMLELYHETFFDLLLDDKPLRDARIRIKQKEHLGVYIEDTHSVVLTGAEHAMSVVEKGLRNMCIRTTNMGAATSRAAVLLRVIVESRPSAASDGDESKTTLGRIDFVDLWGSERQSKTGLGESALKEAAKIGMGIGALGNVIAALTADNSKGKKMFVPYRDSQLTRLMQHALGGSCYGLFVCTVSPSSQCYDESLSTLRYADRIRKITNTPTKNELGHSLSRKLQQTVAELGALVDEAGRLLDPSQVIQLLAARCATDGFEVPHELLEQSVLRGCMTVKAFNRLEDEGPTSIRRFLFPYDFTAQSCGGNMAALKGKVAWLEFSDAVSPDFTLEEEASSSEEDRATTAERERAGEGYGVIGDDANLFDAIRRARGVAAGVTKAVAYDGPGRPCAEQGSSSEGAVSAASARVKLGVPRCAAVSSPVLRLSLRQDAFGTTSGLMVDANEGEGFGEFSFTELRIG